MWANTVLSRKLGIAFPIIQAPMAGGITTPDLIAAVSNAGGLGFLGAGYLPAEDIRKAIQQVRTLSDKPFGINLFIPTVSRASLKEMQRASDVLERVTHELKMNIAPPKEPFIPNFDDQMQVVVEEKITVFSFTFGCLTDDWMAKLRANNTKIIGTATNLAEARVLQNQGVDAIVAQGSEAGGHRGSFLNEADQELISLHHLIPQLLDEITIPIIATGGIMHSQAIAEALHMGASGVQLGTAFVCCEESGAHPSYKQALLNSKVDNTVLTRAFSGKLARGIRNQFITRMEAHTDAILPYPIQHALTTAMRKKAQSMNCIDFMSMWAGQAVALCRTMSATALMEQLVSEFSDFNRL